VLQPGDTVQIAWAVGAGYQPSGVVVTYSVDGGENLLPITRNALPHTTTSCTWVVPATAAATASGLVEVHDYLAPERRDWSDQLFSIVSSSAVESRAVLPCSGRAGQGTVLYDLRGRLASASALSAAGNRGLAVVFLAAHDEGGNGSSRLRLLR
jgi:hypothetical protein